MKKKLKVGWFTFTCCEDSTIIFTELLNTHWRDWKDKIEFVHAKVLQTTNRFDPMDVVFVEGAISSPTQAEKLKKIRGLAKKLVAIGACACIGMPSTQRNTFDPYTKTEISPAMKKFDYQEKVQTVEEVVKVDAKVQGCPMNESVFIETLESAFKEFGIVTNS